MKHQPKYGKQMIKYLINYFIVLGLVIAACCPFIWQAYNKAVENATKQSHNRMQEGLYHLERTFDHLYAAGSFLGKSVGIRKISEIEGELDASEYLYMTEAMNQLSNLFLINDNNCCANFILFPENDVFLSREQVTESFTDFYGYFFQVGDLSAEEFRKKVFETEDSFFLFSVDELLYFESRKAKRINNPLLCIQKIEVVSRLDRLEFAMISVVTGEQIEEWMLMEEMRVQCPFYIEDGYGNLVFGTEGAEEFRTEAGQSERESEAGTWKLLEEENKMYSLRAVMGLPVSVARMQMIQTVGVLILYLVVGLIGVFVLAFYLSYRQYRPIARLADLARQEDMDSMGKDEFEYIGKTLSAVILSKNKYKEQLQDMENRLKVGTMEKLILRGISTQEEAEDMERFLGMPIEYFCVVSINITDERNQYSGIILLVQEYLKQHLHNEIVCISSGFQELIVLIFLRDEEPPHVMGIKAVFEDMTHVVTEETEASLNIGISAIGNGIYNMSTCYSQALQARRLYAKERMNSVGVYILQEDHNFNELMDVDAAQKLRNSLLGGDRVLIEQQFLRMLDKWKKVNVSMLLYRQQIFFFLRHVIWCTAEELSLDSDSIQIPHYQSSWSLDEMLDMVQESCFRICDCIDESKKSRNQKLKDDIITFLQEEYTRCDLTAGMVCRKIGISEKYLYQFIKEQTGRTFVGYLDELRMKRAEELLMEEDYGNVRIAEESGFGSVNTLYRTFNKYKGVTPAVYRKIMREKADIQEKNQE